MSIQKKKCCCGDCWIRPEVCQLRGCDLVPLPPDVLLYPRPPLVKCQSTTSCEALCAMTPFDRMNACLGEDFFTIPGKGPVDTIVWNYHHIVAPPGGPATRWIPCYFFTREENIGIEHEFYRECPPMDLDKDGEPIPVCGETLGVPGDYDPDSEFACLMLPPSKEVIIGSDCEICCNGCNDYCLRPDNCYSGSIPGSRMDLEVSFRHEQTTDAVGLCECITNGTNFQCHETCFGGNTCINMGGPGCEAPYGCRINPNLICEESVCMSNNVLQNGIFCNVGGPEQWSGSTESDGCKSVSDEGNICFTGLDAAIGCNSIPTFGGHWGMRTGSEPCYCCEDEVFCDDSACASQWEIGWIGMGQQDACPSDVPVWIINGVIPCLEGMILGITEVGFGSCT